MKASINSTKRRRLERHRVRLALHQRPNARPSVEAAFDLSDLALPSHAKIILEAHRQSVVERLPFGTVGSPRPERAPELAEVELDGLQFRIKIVDPATGRLLARGDRLTAGGNSGETLRRELFRVRTADLGQEIWRVELSDAEAPSLLLNKSMGDPYAFLHEPRSRATVLPMAMRQVLLRLWLANEDVEQQGDEDEWAQRWFQFAERCAGEEKPPNNDKPAMLDWIDRACAGFATSFGLLDRMLAPGDQSI